MSGGRFGGAPGWGRVLSVFTSGPCRSAPGWTMSSHFLRGSSMNRGSVGWGGGVRSEENTLKVLRGPETSLEGKGGGGVVRF